MFLSRFLMWEAAQAHHWGLNWTLAMDSVFAAPAKAAGLDHRVGYCVEGHDADVVIWVRLLFLLPVQRSESLTRSSSPLAGLDASLARSDARPGLHRRG